jgi:hypothetical protein
MPAPRNVACASVAISWVMSMDRFELALKLVASPCLILAVSLAGRRWGEAVSGWLVGLPMTSGPVVLFLALEHGPAFASASAAGSVAGVMAQAAFCLGYAWMPDRAGLAGALLAGTASFATAAWLLQAAALPVVPLYVLSCVILAIGNRVYPRRAAAVRRGKTIGNDLPLRMIVAAIVVLAITTAAPALGARLSGTLIGFPIIACILAVFAHRAYGPGAARLVLSGMLLGLYSFATFFVVVGVAIVPLGIFPAFALAAAATILVQGGTLLMMRRAGKATSQR